MGEQFDRRRAAPQAELYLAPAGLDPIPPGIIPRLLLVILGLVFLCSCTVNNT